MALPWTFENGLQVATLAVEVLKAITTWPVALVVLGVVFLVRFKEAIDQLIVGIEIFKWGDKEVHVARQSDQNLIEVSKQVLVSAPAPAPAPAPTSAPATPAAATTTPEITAVPAAPDNAALRSAKELAAIWEYQYLHGFLVPRTQFVLDWLANREPTLYSTYDAWWMSNVPEAYERNAVITALQNHHLINVDDTRDFLISVTEKGREYLAYRGPLPEFLKVKWPSRPAPTARAPLGPPPPRPSLASLGELDEAGPPGPAAPRYVKPAPPAPAPASSSESVSGTGDDVPGAESSTPPSADEGPRK